MLLGVGSQVHGAVRQPSLLQFEHSLEDANKLFKSWNLLVLRKRKQTGDNATNKTEGLIFNTGEYYEAVMLKGYLYIRKDVLSIYTVGEGHFPKLVRQL